MKKVSFFQKLRTILITPVIVYLFSPTVSFIILVVIVFLRFTIWGIPGGAKEIILDILGTILAVYTFVVVVVLFLLSFKKWRRIIWGPEGRNV